MGTAIGILAAQRGYTVAAVGGRNQKKVAAAAWQIGPEVKATTILQAAAAARLVLISVSDDAIVRIAENLAQNRALTPQAVVVHLSGALSSDILNVVRD
ncbi:MAG: hypothetical protein AMJ79_12905, partial [Phycisphaerae bacterium SM23_30]